MKNNLFAGKSARTKLFGVITILLIAVLLVVNLGLYGIGVFGAPSIDLTPERLYTLSDGMVKECSFLSDLKNESGETSEVKILFCNDRDYLIDSQMTRVIYYMANELHAKYPNFVVDTVNVSLDPAAVAAYRTTSLTKILPTDMILTYEGKYRIVSADSFWTTASGGATYSYNGEYRLASLLLSLTAVNQPAAYFETGHGESYYDPDDPTSERSVENAYFADLLRDQGLKIKTLDLKTVDRVPEDCAVLILNDPAEDFTADRTQFGRFDYVSDTEKLDRYLVKGTGTILVAKDYAKKLTVLEDFLAEWGFLFSDRLVRDDESSLDENDDLIATYNADTESYGYAIYGAYADLASAPRMIVSDSGYIDCAFGSSAGENEAGSFNTSKVYAPFLSSSSSSVAYAKNPLTGEYVDPAGVEEARDLCAVTSRMSLDSYTAEYTYSYLFCAASADFFSNDLLGNASYANYEITSALVNNVARTDRYADISIGGTSYNSSSFGGKVLVSTEIKEENAVTSGSKFVGLTESARRVYVILFAAIPCAVAIFGAVVAIRRKFL